MDGYMPEALLMADIGKSLFERGLSGGASGNLSLRLADGGWLVTPTGSSLGLLQPEQLSRLDAQGSHCGGLRPTKEVSVHRACYAAHPDCGAVVHLHSPYATAVSCLEGLDPADAVPAFTPYGLMRYGRVGLASYHRPGSAELVAEVERLLARHRALLLQNHGLLVMGKDLSQASDNAEELESSCRLVFMLHGHAARPLTGAEQAELLG